VAPWPDATSKTPMNLAIANANRFGLRFVVQGFVPVAPLCIDPFAHEKHGDPRKDLARHVLLCSQPTHCSKRPHDRSIALVGPLPEPVQDERRTSHDSARESTGYDRCRARISASGQPARLDRPAPGRPGDGAPPHRRLRQIEHEGLPLRDPRGHVTVGPPSEALVETFVAHGVTPQQRRQGGASAGTEPCLSRPPHL